MPLLSLNGRYHWAEQRRRARTIRQAAWATALAAKIPPLLSASVTVEYRPPDRRRRDADNVCGPNGKHAIDALVDAGVLKDDCPPYLAGLSYVLGERVPGGQLRIHITEATQEGAA